MALTPPQQQAIVQQFLDNLATQVLQYQIQKAAAGAIGSPTAVIDQAISTLNAQRSAIIAAFPSLTLT